MRVDGRGERFHAICDDCHVKHYPGVRPAKKAVAYREFERCGWCGKQTMSGIHVLRAPGAVPFQKA